MTQMIFRRKSLERIASPDQLDRYLQVSAPSLWLILLALFLMLGAAAAWCFGAVYRPQFLEPASNWKQGRYALSRLTKRICLNRK